MPFTWPGRLRRKLYVPVAAIVGSVLILAAFVGYTSYRNLHHQAEIAERFMFDKGITIIRALEAGSRYTKAHRHGPECLNTERIQKLATELARDNDLDFLIVFDGSGKVLADSDPSMMGRRVTDLTAYLKAQGGSGGQWPRTFVVGSVFDPFGGGVEGKGVELTTTQENLPQGDYLIFVGLKRAWLNEAEQADTQRAISQGATLLVIGLAGFFFIFVIQNYYVVDRTLSSMSTLTQNIIESMPNVLVAIDGTGRVIEANAAAGDLLGVSRGQVVSEDFLGPAAQPLVHRIRQGQTVLDQELTKELSKELTQGFTKDLAVAADGEGALLPLSLSGAPLRWEGRPAGAVFILRDLRELKAMEEQIRRSEKLAALGRLSATMAHEIRNPLSSIKGFAQLFKKKFPEGSAERGYVDTMLGEVDRLGNVVTNLLDLTRPKEPRLQECDLAEVIRHGVQLVRADAEARGVEVALDLPEAPLPASIDREQIVQVLLNLLLNGLEATPDGGRVSLSLRSGSQGEAEIEVADTGPGVRPEDLPKIFEPFFTTKPKGTGLGLAVALRVVENHHGTLSVTSREGEGTTFLVTLPLGSGRGRDA